MPAWFVYVVRCHDGSLYTGIARDVNARVTKHNQGRGPRNREGGGSGAGARRSANDPGFSLAARGCHQGSAPQSEAGPGNRGGSRVMRLMLFRRCCLQVKANPSACSFPPGTFKRVQSRRRRRAARRQAHPARIQDRPHRGHARHVRALCGQPPLSRNRYIDLTQDPELPVTNVNWHEARAYLRFCRRPSAQ